VQLILVKDGRIWETDKCKGVAEGSKAWQNLKHRQIKNKETYCQSKFGIEQIELTD